MSRSRTAASRAAASGLWHTTNRSARAPSAVAAAGCDPDFLDPQVVGDVVVAAGAGQRGGGLGVGVAQLLGVDVVPAAAGQVGAVGGGGEARGRRPTPAGAGSRTPGRP